MGATQILDGLAGEGLIAIEPPLLQQAAAGWLERLALFTGRALSDTALTQEQYYRSGRLNLLGQAVTQGVVRGLDLSVDLTAKDPVLSVSPGYGISATGQDVTLLRTMHTTLSGLAVLDGTSGLQTADLFGSYPAGSLQQTAGVLLLREVLAAVPGSEVDNGPSEIVVSGNLAASCDQDPAENAFGDPQIVDAAQLVFVTWPSAIPLPSFNPSTNWRNRLAYTIFDAELALGPDDRLPWEFFGVPLAVAGFDAGSNLIFVDRSAVVRTGGLPRRRYIVPFQDGQQNLINVQPALANARVSQFSEQLGEDLTPASPPGLVASEFQYLPPSGILPAYTMDFQNKVALWCPTNWSVTAAPVYREELEGVLQAGITAAPLDTTQNEVIEILVPLPDEVYDPNILQTEVVSAVFQQEVDAATDQRNLILKHRKVIQEEANALAIAAAKPAMNLDAGLTPDEIAARDTLPAYTPEADETFATALVGNAYVSTDVQNLTALANSAAYTVTSGGVSVGLFTTADFADITTHGVQHFIDMINARLASANDILDLGFLTSQTDIYRYRQNVLQTTDATRLAVSPILANIASGVTAQATAQNISEYLASIKPPATPVTTTSTTTTPRPSSTVNTPTGTTGLLLNRALAFKQTQFAGSGLVSPSTVKSVAAAKPVTIDLTAETPKFTEITPGIGSSVNTIDITQQSPIVGAQLNLRTLTIAERLAPPPSQEALMYSVANRAAFLQLLSDLDLTLDDLEIAVDAVAVPQGITLPLTLADLKAGPTSARYQAIFTAVGNPQIDAPLNPTNPDEAELFSVGIHVLEQHTALMRAIEARIQSYQDFLTQCATVLRNIQTSLGGAQALVTQLNGDLTQARQNLAFVSALLADETARVASVTATRINVLQTYVQFVAYNRPRTVVNQPNVASRQLTPVNIVNPAPACLKQVQSIPPELREIVALLREAPVSWFPTLVTQLANLERPSLLQDLASDIKSRATLMLASPPHISSAVSSSGMFAPSIADMYTSDQQVFRSYQTPRAAFQPATLLTQSWTAQVGILTNIAAVADLQTSESIHAEIAAAAARSMQQISSVATCLYMRVGQALPIDRLVWAQYLEAHSSVSLRSLAVLPGWNSQNYTDRQQMQMLVDWLFQQVDATDLNAPTLMNDVVAVAILLASDAPVNEIIAGAVAAKTTPVIGNPIRLTLPSDRVAHGMYVNLYSAGTLTARAVVTDLDASGVTAAFTDIYAPNVALQANDVVHYTAQTSDAVTYKAFS